MTIWEEQVGSATAGATKLLFIHGGLCDGEDWRGVAERCGAGHHGLLFDLPGHGRSDRPTRIELEELIASVIDLADAHGPCILVGHSLGCRLALEAVRRLRRRPRGIVLVEASVMPAGAEESFAALQSHLAGYGAERISRLLAESWRGKGMDRDWYRRRMAGLARCSPGEILALMEIGAQWTADRARLLLQGLSVPLLAIETTMRGADLSRRSLRPDEQSGWLELVQSLVPSARALSICGQGHFPHVEEPGAIAAQILDFARHLSKTAA